MTFTFTRKPRRNTKQEITHTGLEAKSLNCYRFGDALNSETLLKKHFNDREKTFSLF